MFRRLTLVATIVLVVAIAFTSCKSKQKNQQTDENQVSEMQKKVNAYISVKLTTDLSKLTGKEKQMIPILMEVAQIMDDLFWKQTLAEPKDEFLAKITDTAARRFAEINYGPWDRLDDNKPFIDGFGVKPEGANYYPADMTKEEFEKWKDPNKQNLYTVIRRQADGKLKSIWFHDEYAGGLKKASELLLQAAELAEDSGLKNYLTLRAKALTTSNYFPSDMAWMDMKTNTIDFVVGPIENYEDALFGYKTAFEGALLVKDKEWSQKLSHFAALLPELQKQLPVDLKYKQETPGSNSDLNAYDIIYNSGHANEGSKTIAINLPNDEKVQLAKGSRRLQLKNAMKAKFDYILMPIANELMSPDQIKNVKFDAFFSNVMFHEVAHGLGIKNTINGKGNTREALKECYSSIEEAKADILGLFLATKLIEMGEIKDLSIEDCYVTFMAGIFRSVRFGAASAHGKANMMCFNLFEEKGAFTHDADGKYLVDFSKMKTAVDEWASIILQFQGEGDYEGLKAYIAKNGTIHEKLQKDLDQIKEANIPLDIVYEQGAKVLGL